MFSLYANKNRLIVRQREPITSGSINVYLVRFRFSEDWENMTKIAVFRTDMESWEVLLEESEVCTIPWEVLVKPGKELFCGVYGTQDGHTTLPTSWTSLGTILAGVSPGKDAQPPTPELWEQELSCKGDGLSYDGLNLSLMSGETPLSTVQITDSGKGSSSAPSEGGTGLTAGEGLAIEDGTIRVTTPVKGVTQAEYDVLSPEERKGLYVITDASTALPEGGEVYSTEETRIGTWVDGKPIYRICIFYHVYTRSEQSRLDTGGFDTASIDNLIHVSGSCAVSDGARTDIGNEFITVHVAGNGDLIFSQKYTVTGTYEYSGYVVLEYTKITDQEVIE